MDTPGENYELKLPSFRLDGKVALVTGAGTGLGAAISIGLAESGAEVLLVGRTQTSLELTSAVIAQRGGRSWAIVCDVTDSAAVRQVIGALPHLDVLINNAGTNFPEPFVDVSDEHLDIMLDLNVRAAFVVAQAAAQKCSKTQPEPTAPSSISRRKWVTSVRRIARFIA